MSKAGRRVGEREGGNRCRYRVTVEELRVSGVIRMVGHCWRDEGKTG